MQETNKIEDEEEIDIVRKALEFNVRATKLKSHLQQKLQKPGLSTNHVRYVMKKMKGQDKDKEDLSVFLEAIVEEGVKVDVCMDSDNRSVKVLTIKTAEMIKAYHGVNPTVVMFDTTFGFNAEGYKMSAFAYLNPVTNRGEVACLIFISDEGGDSLEFAFQSFKNSILTDPAYCMIDKDFTEISTIKKIFPNCIILLCIFHVLKYQKTLLHGPLL